MMRFIVTGELPGTSVQLSFLTCIIVAGVSAALFCVVVIKALGKIHPSADKN